MVAYAIIGAVVILAALAMLLRIKLAIKCSFKEFSVSIEPPDGGSVFW